MSGPLLIRAPPLKSQVFSLWPLPSAMFSRVRKRRGRERSSCRRHSPSSKSTRQRVSLREPVDTAAVLGSSCLPRGPPRVLLGALPCEKWPAQSRGSSGSGSQHFLPLNPGRFGTRFSRILLEGWVLKSVREIKMECGGNPLRKAESRGFPWAQQNQLCCQSLVGRTPAEIVAQVQGPPCAQKMCAPESHLAQMFTL